MENHKRLVNYIAYISSYPPRECGLATFTQDLTQAMDNKFNPEVKSRIIAINEQPTSIYNYPNKVWNEITKIELPDYVALAKKINERPEIKLVNIQHEFGLFGGKLGDYLIPFLQAIEKPVVTTFHSVLPYPDKQLKNIVNFIASKSKSITVMNNISKKILETRYELPKSKICLIPHGIPQTQFEPSAKFKTQLGFGDKIVLSTFGLLSDNKGIEYAIRAIARLVKRFPNIMYLILGVTHPVVRQQDGEKYRNFLIREVGRLKLKQNVKFYNKYLTLDELITFLKATDIYLYPTTAPEQSVSGTLSYALGCGKPVIAAKTAYSSYMLNGKNGILVKPKNSDAITNEIKTLLNDVKLSKSMSISAYSSSRHMIWPNVAAKYFKLFQKYAKIGTETKKLPVIKFDHLIRMTDSFGVLHFAKYSKPETRYGYSLDDSARALIASIDFYQLEPKPEILTLIKTYLNFIKFVQRPSGNFANIVSYRKERDTTKDEDVQGRGIWALGYAAASHFLADEEFKKRAQIMFEKSLRILSKLKSLRAIAFAMSGLYNYLKIAPTKQLIDEFKKLAEHQITSYKTTASSDWQWFENHLTYSNSKLPESLYYAYVLTKNKRYLEIAEKTLEFLKKITFEMKFYSPIGQNGWYFRHKKRSYFDQQPEDTASMVQTKIVAYKITKKREHLDDAIKAFNWFLGENHLGQMVYDEITGGCHDGIGQNTLNLNQGAESTISYLMARLAFEDPEIKKVMSQ